MIIEQLFGGTKFYINFKNHQIHPLNPWGSSEKG